MNQKNVSYKYVLKNIEQLDKVKDLTLIKGYHQIFEFEENYGLHPDGFDDSESGWPEALRPICAEMWRRVDAPESNIGIENIYYINKWFRQLAVESRRCVNCL